MDFSIVSKAFYVVAAEVKNLHRPLKLAKSVCSVGTWIPRARSLSERGLKRIAFVNGSIEIIALKKALLKGSADSFKPALSIIKRTSELALWADWCGLAHFDDADKWSLKTVSGFSTMAKSSINLWRDIHTNPDDRKLMITVPKFLMSSLLLFSHLTDNQSLRCYVRLASKVFEVGRTGYRLYHKKSFNFQWNITPSKACKVISSIAVAAFAFYVMEKTIDFDSFI